MRRSTGIYPENWAEIARQVKEAAGWKCVRCGHPHDVEAGYMLTVHHLDLDKSNCEWWNIPALCQKCHLQIQHKVLMNQPYMFEHSDWFKPYVAGYYAWLHGRQHDREYAEAHLDDLLAYGAPGGADKRS